MSRYEVREHRVSDTVRARYPRTPEVIYRVWDTMTRSVVPFSNRQSRPAAERICARLNQKEGT